jgi:hypothetical protein
MSARRFSFPIPTRSEGGRDLAQVATKVKLAAEVIQPMASQITDWPAVPQSLNEVASVEGVGANSFSGQIRFLICFKKRTTDDKHKSRLRLYDN